jgi:hypothetical protein
MMHVPSAIKQLFPNAESLKDFTVQDDGKGQYIAQWNLKEPQPTKDELLEAWEQYQLNPPPTPLSELDQVKKQLADLGFELMVKGVI